jgi:hypothetical protein
MNYKNRDDKARERVTVKNNAINSKVYSKAALEKLSSGTYGKTKKVPELKPTVSQNSVSQNNVPKAQTPTQTQQKPSTRYNQNVSTQEKKSTRDTSFDKDFDEFHKYRVGDKIGVMDYDAKTDRDVEHWRNLKTQIMSKNKWSEKEFDDKWDAYYKERSQKEANEEVNDAVKFASKHPVLGTLLQGVYTPQAMIEGGASMLSALPFVSDKYKAQSADDTNFTGTRAKEGIKQAVKDNNIKTGVGKGAYDIATSLGDMAFASAIPVLGTASLGAQTAARQNMNALERGVDPTKAARTGALSGVASGFMNKVGLDKAVNSQAKTALGGVLQGMGIEGAENVAEDSFNLLVDSLMNKDKSQLASLHDYYVSQGMSDEEATSKATTDTLKDLALSGLSGAAFGGVMRGVRNLPELVSDVKALGKYASMNNRGAVDAKALAEEAQLNVKSPAKVEGEKLPEVESPDRALTPQETQVLQDSLKANDYITELRDTFANAEPIDKARMLVDGGYYKDMIEAGKAFKAGKLDDAVSDYLTKMESNGNPTPTKNQVNVNDYDKAELNDKYNGDYEQMRRGMIKEYTGADDAKADDYYKALSTFVTGEGSKADAKVLDDYVDNAPTYNGQISRGMHFEVGDPEYDNFMRQVHEGGTITLGKPSSWASDPAVSRLYSHMGDNTYDSIEIVCNQNRTSTPINFVNMQGENEILSSSKASWTVLKDDTVTMPNGARKTILYVAETGDKTPPKNAVVMPAIEAKTDDKLTKDFENKERVANALSGTGLQLSELNSQADPIFNSKIRQGNEKVNTETDGSIPPEPPRRSFFDDLPRSDKEGRSKVGTNTAVNSNVYTREQIDSDPIISEINKYAKANNDLTYNQAKEDIINDGNNLLNEYTSGKRSITTDLDVDRAMILLTDMANKIDAGDTSLEAQRNLLFSKLRQAGTLYGQTIQAFKKWNNTAEGAIANGEGILHEPVKGWKSQNKQKVELNGRIAKALEQMGVDSSMRNKTTAEKTHEQVKQGVKNVLAKEFGSIDNYFNDNDIEVLTNWAENKVPVWQITDEIEHKLSTGEWYTLDESTQPKYPINQKLKNALDDLVAQEPAVKEPPTLDEIRNEVRTTLDKEMARTGEFTDDDVNYIANLIQNGATKQELSEALNTKMATGKFGISPETQQQVTDLFTYANRFDPNSKQAFDLKTAAYKLIADEAVSEDATPFEKFESWRYLAMLGNPKTMVRNWVGNKMFSAVTGVSNNLAAALEAGTDRLSKALGGEGIQRTKTFLNPVEDRALIKAAGEDGEAHRYSEISGTKYEKGTKDAIKQQKSVFNSKLLRLYEAATDRGISDTSAVKKKYSTSLAGYMKANGLDESTFDADDRYRELQYMSRSRLLNDAERAELDSLRSTHDLLEKARDYAVKQAEYATFHEENAVAKWLTKMSNTAPGPGKAIIEGLVPFKRTPANILRSGFEYSPFGAIKSIAETNKLIYENTGSRKGNLEETYTKKSKITGKEKEVNKSLAADVLDSWSKTLTGSGLAVLGYFLKNHGILNSSNDDEKWQDDLEGKQDYSITINGKTYTLDWAAPAVMPLLMGAEISKIKDRNGLLDKKMYENMDELLGTVNAILDPFLETSMMQGVQNIVESAANANKYNNDGGKGSVLASLLFNAGLGYLTQGVPTVAGQIARTVDNTRRATDTVKDPYSFTGSLEKQGRKLMNKLPGLSMLNNPYYDSYGRTQSNSPWNDPIRGLLYQALSPGYLRDINTTAADESARNAYYALGEPNEEGKQLPIMNKDVFASWKSQVKANGERLNPEEMATYRKTSGEAQYAIRDALTKEDWFNNLDASKQTEILKKVNTLVDKIGKDSVDKLDSSSKDLETYQSEGIPGLLNKWNGDEAGKKITEETGLSASTNAHKEIKQALADGDTAKAQQLSDKAAQDKKDLDELNAKYGASMKLSTYQSYGSKAEAEQAMQDRKKAQDAGLVNKSGQVQTQQYQKFMDRAGSQSVKFEKDLPKLVELDYSKSEMYTYAYAINQDSSLTPQTFNNTYKKMDTDSNGSLKQDEVIDYLNNGKYSQDEANKIWVTYGEEKGQPWKKKPVWNGSKYVKK